MNQLSQNRLLMNSVVNSRHEKDPRSDTTPGELVEHGGTTIAWQRPSERWTNAEGISQHLILFYPFVWGVQDSRENGWLLLRLKLEKNQICFPCMHAAAAKEQQSPFSPRCHHSFTVHDPPNPSPPLYFHKHTKVSYLKVLPNPLMTVSRRTAGHFLHLMYW